MAEEVSSSSNPAASGGAGGGGGGGGVPAEEALNLGGDPAEAASPFGASAPPALNMFLPPAAAGGAGGGAAAPEEHNKTNEIQEAVRQGLVDPPAAGEPKLSWYRRISSQLSALWGATRTKFNNLFDTTSPLDVARRGPLVSAILGSIIYYEPSETDEYLIAAGKSPGAVIDEATAIAAAASRNAGRNRVNALNPLLATLIVLERTSTAEAEGIKQTARRNISRPAENTALREFAEYQFLCALFDFLIQYNIAKAAKAKIVEHIEQLPYGIRKTIPEKKLPEGIRRLPSENFTASTKSLGIRRQVVTTPGFFRIILAIANDCMPIPGTPSKSDGIIALFHKYVNAGDTYNLFTSLDIIPIIVNPQEAKSALNAELRSFQRTFIEPKAPIFRELFNHIQRDIRAEIRSTVRAEPSRELDAYVDTGISSDAMQAASFISSMRQAEAEVASPVIKRQRIANAFRDYNKTKKTHEDALTLRSILKTNATELTITDKEYFNGLINNPTYSGIGNLEGGARRTRSKNRRSQKKVRKVKARKTRVHKKRSTRRRI